MVDLYADKFYTLQHEKTFTLHKLKDQRNISAAHVAPHF